MPKSLSVRIVNRQLLDQSFGIALRVSHRFRAPTEFKSDVTTASGTAAPELAAQVQTLSRELSEFKVAITKVLDERAQAISAKIDGLHSARAKAWVYYTSNTSQNPIEGPSYNILDERVVQYMLSGREVEAASAAFSPDGHTLATVSREGSLSFWNLTTWQTRTVDGSPLLPVRSLAFSPDGQTLAIGTDNSVAAEFLATDDLPVVPDVRRFTSRDSPWTRLAKHPIGIDSRPWNSSGPGFRLWDLATGMERPGSAVCSTLTATPHVDWSRQGLIAVGSDDGTVWIWELGDQASPRLTTRIAVNSRGAEVIDWQPQAGTAPILQSKVHRLQRVTAIAFAPDGLRLAVGSQDGGLHLLKADDLNHPATLSSDVVELRCLALKQA